MAKDQNFSLSIDTDKALLALQRAMDRIHLIEHNDLSASQFRACLPAILVELNSVAYPLEQSKESRHTRQCF